MGKLNDYWRQVIGAEAPRQGAVVTPAEATRTEGTGARGAGYTAANDSVITGEVPFRVSSDGVRRRLESFGLTHIGKVREGNEDQFVIASLQRSLEVRQTSLEDRDLVDRLRGKKAYLFAVADGVGGNEGGRLASGMTLQTIVEYLSETVDSYHDTSAGHEHAFLGPLTEAVHRAHAHLLESFGARRGDGPATTLTMALVVWPRAFLVHVGDSRAYRMRGHELHRLTRDQTMGAFLMDEYKMSAQQAEQGGYNDVLASAVGAADMTPTVSAIDLESGDVLMLCTDGLTKHVSEERIAEVLGASADAESTCRHLVDLALADGGRDNVTVVVAHTLTA